MRSLLAIVVLVGCTAPPARAVAPIAPRPPETDRDGDGIVDGRDKCPDEPEDCDGFADDDGCPDLDNDGDRIPDTCDQCPNAPEVFNGWGDRDGCPDSSADIHRFRDHPTHVYAAPIEWITFGEGSAAVNATELDGLAERIRADGDVESIVCIAQASKTEKKPEALSKSRAEAVCKGLSTRGIGKVVVVGAYGVGTGPMRDLAAELSTEPRALANVIVTRAGGHVIWKWNGTRLEIGETPPINVEPEPKDPRCSETWAPPPPKPPAGGCVTESPPPPG